MLSIDNIQRQTHKTYMRTALDHYGSEGPEAFKDLTDAVRLVFQKFDPHSIQGRLIVVQHIAHDNEIESFSDVSFSKVFPDLETLAATLHDHATCVEIAILCHPDETSTLYICDTEQHYDEAALVAPVFIYKDGIDTVMLGSSTDVIEKPSSIMLSNFAAPTYSGLDDALEAYRSVAARCTCEILQAAWVGGVKGPRLFLANKPEIIMRKSLTRELQVALRDTTVKPEHNTDDKRPVDIVVQWYGSGHSALIEIKWLGTALAESKSKNETFTSYSASRAQDGAKQLAEYLELENESKTVLKPKGYLVVFDGRRRALKGVNDKISGANALHYQHQDLTFTPDHSSIRTDFSIPVRYFLEPRRNQFLEASP